jgi:hypothetical protein
MSISETVHCGYTLIAVERSPGWEVRIYPGANLLHTHPDHVSGITREEAFAKARAVIDHHLTG